MGHNRPYTAPADVNAKLKRPVFYIRYGTSSIEAKGEFLDQLRDMANRVPFDDRGNEDVSIEDISPLLLKDYLKKIDSRLAKANFASDMETILDQMQLYDGPKEKRLIKNVAAMMFSEHPEKFFPTTQVDIVVFPEGRENAPENFIEIPPIKGPVPMMIRNSLEYLRTNIIKERITKPIDDERSVKVFNYPFQALEEAVVNALYHRDYKEREPVEITIEPDRISILSYSGPDRSISMESLKEANMLRSRRYRNRRLGDFLKELDLTEGRANIPARKDFVQDAEIVKEPDTERIKLNMSKMCPRCVQDMSMNELGLLAVCLLRAQEGISAQEMLDNIDKVSFKQKKRKYLNKLLEMGAILMTIPDKPTSKNQKYILSDIGYEIVHKQ